jgi:tetratricopeptide (TPR) repeat protein
MASDDHTGPNDSSRKHMLEEIRRRAEEAEMKRLEDEERKRTAANKQKSAPPSPAPSAPVEPLPASNRIAIEQKALVIHERLLSALERGKLEKATELYAEFARLVPSSEELPELKNRLAALREERIRAKEDSRPPPPSIRHSEPPAQDKAARDVQRKKIADMLEAANIYYQQEKYDRALNYVIEILKLDPAHGPAQGLKSQIEQARTLEAKVRMEEEQRRAHERASTPTKIMDPLVDQPSGSGRPTDFWGSSLSGPKLESEYDLLPEQKGPVGPPKRPFTDRIATRLSEVKIPVKPLLTIAAFAVLAVAVYFLIDTIRNTVAPARYSLLVLPAITGGDSTMTTLADAFAEDLISEMGRAEEMRVISPATAFAFRGSSAAPLTLARAVGANFVFYWSALRQDDSITLDVTFADTVKNSSLWNKRYQFNVREFPALRPEVMQNIANAMDVKLTSGDRSSMYRLPTKSEAAYDFYSRGRALLRSGSQFNTEEAITDFDQALRLDPDYAEAHAASAWAHMLAFETSPDLAQSHIAQALSSVQKAISGGLRNAEVFRAWGLAEQFRGQYSKAIERFQQAVTIAPSDGEAQRRLAVALAITGASDAAVKAAQRSVADDRGNIASYITLGQIHQFHAIHLLENRDELKAALAAYDQGVSLARDRSDYTSGLYTDVLVHLQLASEAMNIMLDRVARERESYLDFYKLGRVEQTIGKPIPEWQGTLVRARSLLNDHLVQHPDDAVASAYLALVNTRLGSFKEAHSAILQAQQIAPNDLDVLYLTSRMFALQKDKRQALAYLQKALTRRFSLSAVLDMDFYNLYSDPEFIATITPEG